LSGSTGKSEWHLVSLHPDGPFPTPPSPTSPYPFKVCMTQMSGRLVIENGIHCSA